MWYICVNSVFLAVVVEYAIVVSLVAEPAEPTVVGFIGLVVRSVVIGSFAVVVVVISSIVVFDVVVIVNGSVVVEYSNIRSNIKSLVKTSLVIICSDGPVVVIGIVVGTIGSITVFNIERSNNLKIPSHSSDDNGNPSYDI